jgi:hypothetical protein
MDAFAMINVNKKRRRGRPATGHDPLIAARIPRDIIDKIDKWADENDIRSRSAAIAKLLAEAVKKLNLRR